MEIKDEIIDMLKATERDGIQEFIESMIENGFFEAPCSGGNHLCKLGGLAEHSLNVCKAAMKLAIAWNMTDMMDSVVIVSLLHDYGKCGDYGKRLYVDNVLKSGKVSQAKPFKRNPEILEKNHAVKSVVMINRWFDLTGQEEYAILHHDGLYERANYEAMMTPTPLLMILHFADLWSSRVIEKAEFDEMVKPKTKESEE